MGEQALRLKGRLGELKYGALPLAFLLIHALIFVVAGPLATARKNPSGPTRATLSQLLDKTLGNGRYVTITGTAIYAAGISESEDGKLVAFYYPPGQLGRERGGLRALLASQRRRSQKRE
jgi:hypothetical protein